MLLFIPPIHSAPRSSRLQCGKAGEKRRSVVMDGLILLTGRSRGGSQGYRVQCAPRFDGNSITSGAAPLHKQVRIRAASDDECEERIPGFVRNLFPASIYFDASWPLLRQYILQRLHCFSFALRV